MFFVKDNKMNCPVTHLKLFCRSGSGFVWFILFIYLFWFVCCQAFSFFNASTRIGFNMIYVHSSLDDEVFSKVLVEKLLYTIEKSVENEIGQLMQPNPTSGCSFSPQVKL